MINYKFKINSCIKVHPSFLTVTGVTKYGRVTGYNVYGYEVRFDSGYCYTLLPSQIISSCCKGQQLKFDFMYE